MEQEVTQLRLESVENEDVCRCIRLLKKFLDLYEPVLKIKFPSADELYMYLVDLEGHLDCREGD